MLDSAPHPVVSFDSDLLILVDSEDRETGSLDKARCHEGKGILHRAFSLFVFNSEGAVLMQRRSRQKRLWPAFWSNSCCSHPRVGEKTPEAAKRRLEEESSIDLTNLHLHRLIAGILHRLDDGSRLSRAKGNDRAPSPATGELGPQCTVLPRDFDQKLDLGA